jgi:PKD repeat protein
MIMGNKYLNLEKLVFLCGVLLAALLLVSSASASVITMAGYVLQVQTTSQNEANIPINTNPIPAYDGGTIVDTGGSFQVWGNCYFTGATFNFKNMIESSAVTSWTVPTGYGYVAVAQTTGSGYEVCIFYDGTVAPNATVAAFTASTTTGAAPLTVTFTDQSSNTPTSWAWSFGDGSTSTLQNPSHTYNNTGTFTVNLTAANEYGEGSISKPNYIQVQTLSALTSLWSASPSSGNAPLSVQFTDESLGSPSSYYWDFGAQGTCSNAQNPVVTYNYPGSYNVNHEVSLNGKTSWNNQTAVITVNNGSAPVSSFQAIDNGNGDYSFLDTSTGEPTTWLWDLLPTGLNQNTENWNYNFGLTGDGVYSLSLTASNAYGSSTSTQTITVSDAVVTPTQTPVVNVTLTRIPTIPIVTQNPVLPVVTGTISPSNVTTIATLNPVGITIVNSSQWEQYILNSSPLGSALSPALSFSDSIGSMLTAFGLAVTSILMFPLNYIIPGLTYIITYIAGAVSSFISLSQVILSFGGQIFAVIPSQLQQLMFVGVAWSSVKMIMDSD